MSSANASERRIAAVASFGVFGATSVALVSWFKRVPYRAAAGAGFGLGGVAYSLAGLMALILHVVLFAPLMAYYTVDTLMDLMSSYSPPLEPEDPLERAKFAEASGQPAVAVERYWWVLQSEPDNGEARVRLATLLARTRRAERAKAVAAEGLSREGTPEDARTRLRELLAQVGEERLGEKDRAADLPRIRALEGNAPMPRYEARRGRDDDDGSIPLEGPTNV
jgi:hypothetical protein